MKCGMHVLCAYVDSFLIPNYKIISDFDTLSTTLYSDLPKGGPSQSTWLEMDDLLQNIFSSNPLIKDYEKVIEIGILELDTAKVKLLKSLR